MGKRDGSPSSIPSCSQPFSPVLHKRQRPEPEMCFYTVIPRGRCSGQPSASAQPLLVFHPSLAPNPIHPSAGGCPCPAQGRTARAMSPLPRGLHQMSQHQGPSSSPPLPSAPALSLATCQACRLGSRLAMTGPHAITNTSRLCPCHSSPRHLPASLPPSLPISSSPAACSRQRFQLLLTQHHPCLLTGTAGTKMSPCQSQPFCSQWVLTSSHNFTWGCNFPSYQPLLQFGLIFPR